VKWSTLKPSGRPVEVLPLTLALLPILAVILAFAKGGSDIEESPSDVLRHVAVGSLEPGVYRPAPPEARPVARAPALVPPVAPEPVPEPVVPESERFPEPASPDPAAPEAGAREPVAPEAGAPEPVASEPVSTEPGSTESSGAEPDALPAPLDDPSVF
jgi:hypothetical protein